jgi:hypothetical protein
MEAYFKLISIKYEKIYVFNQFIKDNLINKQFSKIIKIWLLNTLAANHLFIIRARLTPMQLHSPSVTYRRVVRLYRRAKVQIHRVELQ